MTQPTAIIFKTLTNRYAFRSQQRNGTYRVSNGHWASAAYAAKVAKQNGFLVTFEP